MPTLHWLTRDDDLKAAGKAEYRLLAEDEKYSCGDTDSGNIIVQGDNLEALKALLPFYAGQVKCVYIDPPFNTGAAFNHYDDNLEHTIWLSIMYPRLELLRDLLREDGIICVHLDDEELAYMKIIMDEIFGRNNYLNMITMTTNEPSGFKATSLSLFSTANYILMYAKNRKLSKINKIFIEKDYDTAYSKVLLNKESPYQEWMYENICDVIAKENGFVSVAEAKRKVGTKVFDEKIAAYALENADNVFRTAAIGGGAKLKRNATIEKSKRNKNSVFVHPNEDVEGFYILNGEQILFYSARLSVVDGEKKPVQTITDVWTDISWTGMAREGEVEFKNGKKPERLVQRVFSIITKPGDLVLDSFLGSGTTAAVAHKMRRRYIGIEMGAQAKTHCVERLKKVISGEQGGISKSVNWQGGGGFRFYNLGAPIFDENGQIRDAIKFDQLAAHIWFYETKTPFGSHKSKPKANANAKTRTPFLGVHNNTAYALLYNGILCDKNISGWNVLTSKTLAVIYKNIGKVKHDKLVIYGEASRLGSVRLKELGIVFKQIPYDVRAR